MEHLNSSQPQAETLTEHVATEDSPFHFTDSGLDDVYLVGIKYFASPSGRVVAEIPAINQLVRLIAQDLVFSAAALSGQKIRFLRKRLGMKSGDYAKLLRVDLSTLSRIENDKQAVSDQLDALARMSYLLLSNDPQLATHAERLKNLITTEVHKRQLRIVMKISAEHEWSETAQAA